MGKRVSSLDTTQLGFTFEAPSVPRGEAELAGFERFMAGIVAMALKEDERDRYGVAAAVSRLMGFEVSKEMLDAYASEARDNHNVSAARFFAIIAVTKRHDLLDIAVKRIGARVLVGEEILTAQLGHIDRQIAELTARKKSIAAQASPIIRRGANAE